MIRIMVNPPLILVPLSRKLLDQGMPDGGWEPYISKGGESGQGWQVRRRGGIWRNSILDYAWSR